MFKNIITKFRLNLIKWLSRGEDLNTVSSKTKEKEKPEERVVVQNTQPIARQPGLKCPECSTLIPMSIDLLLSESSFHCPGCALQISIDKEQSKACLNALQKLDTNLKNAKAVQQQHQHT